MSNVQIAYFWCGWFGGAVVADLEIGWWAVPVATAIGVLMGVTTTLWKRKFT